MLTNELKKYVEDALEQVPEEHRRRGVAAGGGAAVGGVVGSLLVGPVGVAVSEKSKNGGGEPHRAVRKSLPMRSHFRRTPRGPDDLQISEAIERYWLGRAQRA